jgi:Ni/Fe-hydrogenase subunit HybB-like protein
VTVHVAGRAVQADPRLAWRSVRAEALAFPRSLRLWLGFLSVFLAIGAIAALRSLIPGDKGVGTTPSFEWGILIIGYVFFAITTSGLCLASSLGTVFGIERFRPLEKRHAILAVLSLVTAFGIIALDLHYPIRLMFGVMLNPSPTSPMWWMGVCYGFYLCVLLVEVWSMFTDHPSVHQYACTAAMCTAIVAPTTLGAVFGVVAARAFWSGPFTPILMVVSAFLSGTSLLGIVFYVVHRLRLAGWERAASVAIPSIRLLLTIGILLVAALVARQVVVGMLSSDPGLEAATRALVLGPLAVEFWGLRVIAGLIVPFLLVVLPATRTPGGTFAASILIWVGVFTDRFTFVSAGQIAPVTAVSGVVSEPYAAYTPSPVEIGIILGAFAFVAFAYTMAERYLDLREAEAHAGLSLARIMPARFRRGIASHPVADAAIASVTAEVSPPVVEASRSVVAASPSGSAAAEEITSEGTAPAETASMAGGDDDGGIPAEGAAIVGIDQAATAGPSSQPGLDMALREPYVDTSGDGDAAAGDLDEPAGYEAPQGPADEPADEPSDAPAEDVLS